MRERSQHQKEKCKREEKSEPDWEAEMREGRAAAVCFEGDEGKEARANSGVAVCKNRLVFFALLMAFLETRVTPRAVSIVVNDEDDDKR